MNVTKGANQVTLVGDLLEVPIERELPNGRVFLSFTVVIPDDDGPATSVPVTWFDPPKRSYRWDTGDQVAIVGSIARRFFRFQGRTVPVTEVRVTQAELVRHHARFQKLVEAVPGKQAAFTP